MKFVDFLLESESSYKKAISFDEAIKLFKENCSNMDWSKPYWRGNRDEGTAYLVDGSKGYRKSSDTTNFYNILMDNFATKDQPLRSKSIICTNNAGKTYAKRWAEHASGDLFAVFPYNTAKIGYVGKNDIWDISLTINKDKRSLEAWNKLYTTIQANDESYDDFVKSVKYIFEMDPSKMNNYQRDFYYIFGRDIKKMEQLLADAYSSNGMKFKVGDTANLDNNTKSASEVWIGGPCVLINYDIWIDLKDKY